MIEEYLSKDINFKATLDKSEAYDDAHYIIVATPTNYDEKTNYFDTSSIEQVLDDLNQLKVTAVVIIKSTIPVGFTAKVQQQFPDLKIVFSPEFLREGKVLFDNLYPSRIVVGDKSEVGQKISELFKNACLKPEIDIALMDSTEADAIKLFSYTYLAMRVAYFNELDSYCESHGLNSKNIIQTVGLDPHIGTHYNNPSFGYDGYWLPKDTKQLLANYQAVPQNLIRAIIQSNTKRKDFNAEKILQLKPKVVGIYRLVIKQGFDNFIESVIQGIMKRIKVKGVKIIVYVPNLVDSQFFNSKVVQNFESFKQRTDVIIANRTVSELNDLADKVYTRNLFGEN